jgi:predicted permease
MSALNALRRRVWRPFVDQPFLAAVTVVALVVGVGINSLTFSVLTGLWFNAVPYEDGDRLVVISNRSSSLSEVPLPQEVVTRLSDDPAFDDIAFARTEVTRIDFQGHVKFYLALRVTPNFLSVVRDPLQHGPRSGFSSLPGPEVILGHGLWVQQYAADPSVVGRTIVLNGEPHRVVGVTSAVMDRIAPFGMFVPWHGAVVDTPLPTRGIAKIREALTVDDIRPHVAYAGRLASRSTGDRLSVVSLRDSVVGADVKTTLMAMWAFAGLLAVVAACSVASLQASRAIRQSQATSIRLLLGAPRWSVVWNLIADGMVYAAAGCVIGVGVALVGSRVVAAQLPAAFGAALATDLRAVAITATLGLVAGTAAGFQPALMALRSASMHPSQGTAVAMRRRWTQYVLISLPVMLSTVVLTAAVLLTRTFWALAQEDLGLTPHQVFSVSLASKPTDSPTNPDQGRRALTLADRLRGLPFVEAVGTADLLPFGGGRSLRRARAAGVDGEGVEVSTVHVSSGYFETLGIRPIDGRVLTASDDQRAAPVGVITEAVARALWPNQAAVSRSLQLSGGQILHVVGVVPDVRDGGPLEPARPQVYLPWAHESQGYLNVFVRVATSAAEPDLGRAVQAWASDNGEHPPRLNSLAQAASDLLAMQRIRAAALMVLGIASVALSITIVTALSLQAAAERQRELAVRAALGCSIARGLSQLVFLTARPVLIGVVAGLLSSVWAMRMVAPFLSGVASDDVFSLTVSGCIVVACCVVAALLSVWRHGRVSTFAVLRNS